MLQAFNKINNLSDSKVKSIKFSGKQNEASNRDIQIISRNTNNQTEMRKYKMMLGSLLWNNREGHQTICQLIIENR